jgi:hypothetical protein
MATLKKCESLKTAEGVLKALNRLGFSDEASETHVACYDNGREQGFHLVMWFEGQRTDVMFAQARSSDEIVVYAGLRGEEFDHRPTERAYWARKTYPQGQTAKAARYIRAVVEQANRPVKLAEAIAAEVALDAFLAGYKARYPGASKMDTQDARRDLGTWKNVVKNWKSRKAA